MLTDNKSAEQVGRHCVIQKLAALYCSLRENLSQTRIRTRLLGRCSSKATEVLRSSQFVPVKPRLSFEIHPRDQQRVTKAFYKERSGMDGKLVGRRKRKNAESGKSVQFGNGAIILKEDKDLRGR